MRDSAGLEVLDKTECLRLLAEAPIGRVVFTDQALPAVQPVVFAVHDGTIIFRTCDGKRVAEATDGAVVAFEADEFDAATRTGWSVTVVGPAATVTDADSVAALVALPLVPWAPADRHWFIRVEVTHITGRRLGP